VLRGIGGDRDDVKIEVKFAKKHDMAVEQTAIASNTVHPTPIISVGAGDAQRIVISLYVSSPESGYITLTSGNNVVVRDFQVAAGIPGTFTGKILVNPGENLGVRGLNSDSGAIVWEDMSWEQWTSMTEEQWSSLGVGGIALDVYAVHSDI